MMQRIVVHGDSVNTPLKVGPMITVEVTGGIALTGTGHATISDKMVCLVKDVQEKSYDFTYTKSPYDIAGNGKIRIEAVAADHVHSPDAVMVSSGKVTLVFKIDDNGEARMDTPEQEPDPAPPSGPHEFDLKMSNNFVSTAEQ